MDDARVKLIQEIKDRAKEIGANPMICSMGKVMKEPEYMDSLRTPSNEIIF